MACTFCQRRHNKCNGQLPCDRSGSRRGSDAFCQDAQPKRARKEIEPDLPAGSAPWLPLFLPSLVPLLPGFESTISLVSPFLSPSLSLFSIVHKVHICFKAIPTAAIFISSRFRPQRCVLPSSVHFSSPYAMVWVITETEKHSQ